MQLATALIALGGDKGNTVPRYDLTPAEAAVLMAIHGDDSVHEIDITGENEVSAREEVARLKEKYQAKDPDTGELIAERVFPGRAPDAPTAFEELGLPDTLYKATSRATPDTKSAAASDPARNEADKARAEAEAARKEAEAARKEAEELRAEAAKAKEEADALRAEAEKAKPAPAKGKPEPSKGSQKTEAKPGGSVLD